MVSVQSRCSLSKADSGAAKGRPRTGGEKGHQRSRSAIHMIDIRNIIHHFDYFQQECSAKWGTARTAVRQPRFFSAFWSKAGAENFVPSRENFEHSWDILLLLSLVSAGTVPFHWQKCHFSALCRPSPRSPGSVSPAGSASCKTMKQVQSEKVKLFDWFRQWTDFPIQRRGAKDKKHSDITFGHRLGLSVDFAGLAAFLRGIVKGRYVVLNRQTIGQSCSFRNIWKTKRSNHSLIKFDSETRFSPALFIGTRLP